MRKGTWIGLLIATVCLIAGVAMLLAPSGGKGVSTAGAEVYPSAPPGLKQPPVDPNTPITGEQAINMVSTFLRIAAVNPLEEDPVARLERIDKGDWSGVDPLLPNIIDRRGLFQDESYFKDAAKVLVALAIKVEREGAGFKPVVSEGAAKGVHIDGQTASMNLRLFITPKQGQPRAEQSLSVGIRDGEWKVLPFSLKNEGELVVDATQRIEAVRSEASPRP